jgi:hypothetical protein
MPWEIKRAWIEEVNGKRNSPPNRITPIDLSIKYSDRIPRALTILIMSSANPENQIKSQPNE